MTDEADSSVVLAELQVALLRECNNQVSLQYLKYMYLLRAVDKEYLYLVIIRNTFCQFCIKTYVVTPHLNRLAETVQMRD